jgi:hypothetical protein
MRLSYFKGPRDNPESVPPIIVRLDGSSHPAPSGSFVGYVLGSQAESWPAQGDFAAPAPSN